MLAYLFLSPLDALALRVEQRAAAALGAVSRRSSRPRNKSTDRSLHAIKLHELPLISGAALTGRVRALGPVISISAGPLMLFLSPG